MTNDIEHCYVCRHEASIIHEIYGKETDTENGFWIPVCERCQDFIQRDRLFAKGLIQQCDKRSQYDK